MGITNNVDTTRSQSFTYDHLNRILTAETTSTYATSPTHCWGESYTYDQWGNLTAIGVASTSYNSCTQESLSVSALSNNQLSATGYTYDASGNMLTDGRNTYTGQETKYSIKARSWEESPCQPPGQTRINKHCCHILNGRAATHYVHTHRSLNFAESRASVSCD